MKKTNKHFTGLSFNLDPLFLRNLILILAAILIWRGVWSLADEYIFPENFFLSNLFTIAIGFFLLFIFDTEVKADDKYLLNENVK